MTGSAEFTYDRGTIVLHWLTAGLVVVLWVLGQSAEILPRGPMRSGLWSVHVLLGFLLAVVIVLRLLRRLRHGAMPASDRLIERVAAVAHAAMYLLLVTVVALGVWNAFLRGQNLFDLMRLPQIPADRAFRRAISAWHEWSSHLLVAIALLHAAMALLHHYVLRDGVLRRMLPRLAAGTRRSLG